MPPLLGMLLTGPIHPPLCLSLVRYCTQEYSLHRCGKRSCPGMVCCNSFHSPGMKQHSSKVSESPSKVVILLRACLGLSPEALRKLSAMVFRLAFMPCLAESLAGKAPQRLILLQWLSQLVCSWDFPGSGASCSALFSPLSALPSLSPAFSTFRREDMV